ncbi:hypothetical protein [Mycobacterium tuberculosis]|uniref:hypothetical protein n=1 Tax=Mycobacterium tuberculosis TaxID=1773 RepID=UPI0009A13529|nr:hypothetical protein [Mycobacterium tuberculosis]
MTDDVRDVNTETTDATEVAEIDSAAGEAGDSATEAFDTDSATESTAQKGQRHRDLWRMQVTLKPVPVILILLMLISGGATGWLYLEQYRPDQQTDSGATRAAVAAASDGTIALLSYSPDTLDQDFATARSHLAGDFLSYYDQFTQQIVAPAAKQKSLKTTAKVVRAAVSELHPDSAVVLVFVDQSTTSKDSPNPSMAASSVMVTLAKVDGNWLITKFTPV